MGWLSLGRKNEETLVLDVTGPCRIFVKPVQCVKGRCRIATEAPRETVTITRMEVMGLLEPVAAEETQ